MKTMKQTRATALWSQRPVKEWMRTLHRLQPYRTHRAMLLALASGVILSGVMTLGAITPGGLAIEPGFHIGYTSVANLLLFTVLYLYNFWTIRCGFPANWHIVAGLVGSLLISAAFSLLQWWLETVVCSSAFNSFSITLIIDSAAALIAYLISLLLNNVTRYQQTLIENEHLQAENMRIRYETLEQQLSPHFLFNSLNTLDGLIGIDNNGAHSYLHALSDTFRYTLSRHQTVTLAEELQFTHCYVAMMQMRYGKEALIIEENINPSLLERHLPPISLQLLVENAVKHNVATLRRPLKITIESGNNSVTVSNAKQPKAEHDESTGTGLANLSGRYNMLFHKDINITSTDSAFIVELPLEGEP